MKKFLSSVLVLLISLSSFVGCNKYENSKITCISCGEIIASNSVYCQYCGVSIETSNNNSKFEKENKTEKIQISEDIKEKIKIYGVRMGTISNDEVYVYIDWENLCEKEIKYMNFNVELYNRVGDVISCDVTGEKDKWIHQTGPIPKGKGMYSPYHGISLQNGGEYAFREGKISYDDYQEDKKNNWAGRYWDSVWYNSNAHIVKIIGVKIEYMDGSIFTETNRDVFNNLEYGFMRNGQKVS